MNKNPPLLRNYRNTPLQNPIADDVSENHLRQSKVSF